MSRTTWTKPPRRQAVVSTSQRKTTTKQATKREALARLDKIVRTKKPSR